MVKNASFDSQNIICVLFLSNGRHGGSVCVCVFVCEETQNVQQMFFEQDSGSLSLDVSQVVYSVLVAATGADTSIVFVTDEDEGHQLQSSRIESVTSDIMV